MHIPSNAYPFGSSVDIDTGGDGHGTSLSLATRVRLVLGCTMMKGGWMKGR